MKSVYFKLTVNSIFFFLLNFFVWFVFLYYFLPRNSAIGFSISLSIILLIIKNKVDFKKEKNKFLTSEKNQNVILIGEELALMTFPERIKYFSNAYKNEKVSCQKFSKGVLTEKGERVFLLFSFDSLSKTEIVSAFNRLQKNERALLYCVSAKDDVLNFAKRFNDKVTVLQVSDAYSFLEKNGCLPPVRADLIHKKNSLSFLKEFFDRKKAKRFLTLGLFLLLFSFITPFKIYYVISGTAIALLGLTNAFFAPNRA